MLEEVAAEAAGLRLLPWVEVGEVPLPVAVAGGVAERLPSEAWVVEAALPLPSLAYEVGMVQALEVCCMRLPRSMYCRSCFLFGRQAVLRARQPCSAWLLLVF